MKRICHEQGPRIDPHVHCRDGKEAYKTTIKEVLEIAKKQGIVAIFDMPNTNPPILTKKDVNQRLKLAKSLFDQPKYFLYLGLTPNEAQIREAVKVAISHPQVVGLKLYTVTLNSLGVPSKADQEKIYKLLKELDYRGVLAVHCEKESKFKLELWDPRRPWTHSFARPPEAEIESAKDQIQLAKAIHFKGTLHICHVSCPETVDLIQEAKKEIKITCGVTPHHVLLSEEKLKKPEGLLYKVNPPLRDRKRVQDLRKRLLEKKIDWIETDHAPHTREEKLNPPYLSGLNSLHSYQDLLNWLSRQGLTWSEIEALTYWNIKKTFEEKLKEV